MFERTLQKLIEKYLGKDKVIVIIGARQVGKTTLIKTILRKKDYLFLNGDDPEVQTLLQEKNTSELRALIGNHKILYIDEAQQINNIGITTKLISDEIENVQVILTGSSAFDLNQQINEPLTGRKFSFELFPLSWEEFENNLGYLESQKQLEHRLIYGMYPEVVTELGDETKVLTELANSYLFKDILAVSRIRKPEVLTKLLRALAFQVGSEVSYNEVAQLVGIDKNTVINYIDLLKKSYVVFKLSSFSRNLRNEIKTNQKIYFYDNGIRNVVIKNLNSVALRNDIGILWENFLISERLKMNSYKNHIYSSFFWRTKQQQEIDYVEEKNGEIKGYEFKWNQSKKVKKHKKFMEAYSAEIEIVNQKNFREFLGI